jgi:hypothetical protein
MHSFISRDTCLKLALAAVLSAAIPLAHADITTNDSYFGQSNSGSGASSQASDVIGSCNEFDIDKIVFIALTPGNVTVQVDFNHSVPGSSTTPDLGLNPYVFPKATLPVGDRLFDGVDKYGWRQWRMTA